MRFSRLFFFSSAFSLFLILFFLASFLLPVFAQTSVADVDARRAQLQAELEQEEAAIAVQTLLLQAKQKDTATVSGEVNLLKSQIAQSQAAIKAKKVAITRLGDDIASRQTKINKLSNKIKADQLSLAELLRQKRDTEELSFVEIMLDGNQLTEIFRDVDDAEAIQESLAESFKNMRATQVEAKREQEVLEQKQDAELDAQKLIEQQKKVVEKKEADKSFLLAVTKNQEANYKKLLADRQRKAAQIRAALFALRDTAAIPFGEALAFATAASQKTGVRPAFVLAILTQESNLGQNQGSCLLSSLDTGDGVGKNTGNPFEKVMKAPRDTVPFQAITSRLGRDWKSTPVSCPISSPKYYSGRGYGGAMGPAQFIPSTWELFKARVGSLLGLTAESADPWNPGHAFMASAVYLSDLGASSKTYSAEVRAACKYYGSGGATCTYGKQVMAKASDIQLNMIDPLQNN